MYSFTSVCLLCIIISSVTSESCNQLFGNESSFACVCNEASCGFIGQISPSPEGSFNILTSTMDGLRFQLETREFDAFNDTATIKITINESDVRQRMFGFGGSFTDATGINVATLSSNLQDVFIRQYFSPEGIEYNMARVPIAGCDFSTHPYSYDDIVGDIDLVYFNLTMEDYLYKIPLIKRAEEISARSINLFGSPWSPPSWMKENGMFNGTGGILVEYLQPWSNYFVKFLDAYKTEGISLWGLTAQNEPATAGTTDWAWNACKFTAEEQRDFVKGFLGPALNASGYRPLKLMITDDSREVFPDYPKTILIDSEAERYVDGIAVHWYADKLIPPSVLTETHDLFPGKFLLYTESSTGYAQTIISGGGQGVKIGSWERAENYAFDIIEDVNHWSTGWVDWNMALDMNGGPNWASNFLDATIVINTGANEFYKQPMFYTMGHFSKLVPEGSYAVSTTVEKVTTVKELLIGTEKISATSFINPAGYIVVIILSENSNDVTVQVNNSSSGKSFNILIPARSIQTLQYTI